MTKAAISETDLRELLLRDEWQQLEFKASIPTYKDISEYAVGMGNEGGGLLVLGVSDKKPRQIVGVPLQDHGALQKIRDSVMESAGIRVEFQQLACSGTNVLVVQIPPRPRGHVFSTKRGRFLMRTGEGLRGMTLTEIEDIRNRELSYRDFLAEHVDASWVDVIDPVEIQRLKTVLTANGRFEMARQSDEDLLSSTLDLVQRGKKGKPTRAAILYSGLKKLGH